MMLQKRTLYEGAVFVFVGVIGIVMVFPFVWMVSSSFKSIQEVFSTPIRWLPATVRIDNYATIFERAPFGRYFVNSLFVAICGTLINLVFCSLAGYGFARYRTPLMKVLFVAILSLLMIPSQVKIIPLYLIVRNLGWLDTLTALIVPHSVTPFGIFLLRQFVSGLPEDLFDAATIDGCGPYQRFFQIALPLIKPALATLTILVFMWYWNSFLWPLIVISTPIRRTIALGLSAFVFTGYTEYHLLMAASTFALMPILIVFVFMQRQFIASMALSGLKG